MPPFNSRRSFALKLALFYALFFGVISAGGVALLYNLVRTHTLSEIDQELLERKEEIGLAAARIGLSGLRSEFSADSEAYGRQDYFIRLLDRSGKVLVSSDTSAWPLAPLPDIDASDDSPQFSYLHLPDARSKARILSAIIGDDAILQLGISLEENENFLRLFRRYALIIVFSMLTLGTLIGWALARKAMAGVEAVTRTAAGIAGGNFAHRVEAAGYGREIDDLVSTFNRMASRVQNLMEQMRQVNDNIAHDLRSPLTRIRGLAEGAAMNGNLGHDGIELAGSIVEECDRLIQMINTMLDISETEVGMQGLRLEAVEPARLARDVFDLFQDVALDKGIHLSADIPSVAAIQGDRRKLQRALANLLDNALKYTPSGGEVKVSLTEDANRIAWAVQDTGQGIAPVDLPHIFERFYRGDRSRHLAGSGLGLSLVRAIARAHGGDVSVESRFGQGSIFTMALPKQAWGQAH